MAILAAYVGALAIAAALAVPIVSFLLLIFMLYVESFFSPLLFFANRLGRAA